MIADNYSDVFARGIPNSFGSVLANEKTSILS